MPRNPDASPPAAPPSTVRLPDGPWPTVLDALAARFPRVGRATWAERLARAVVEDACSGPLAPDAPHVAGRVVRYWREVPDEPPVPFDEVVLHVDEHLVVVDKPHFLAVMPAGRHARETLVARVERRLGERGLTPLHRLDRATAGLVLLARTPASRAAYQALFRERRIRKTYHALAPPLCGALPRVRHTRLERGEPFHRMREAPGTPNAETHVAVLARGTNCWLYELMPTTGRKHQLRVHMAALGAPIRGDDLYPEPRPRAPDDYSSPLQLVARRLEFDDPCTGERRSFESRATLDDY
jgi:tRNA pseudouridine32 synthase / 23S rRNA pseudouridine746 synthase